MKIKQGLGLTGRSGRGGMESGSDFLSKKGDMKITHISLLSQSRSQDMEDRMDAYLRGKSLSGESVDSPSSPSSSSRSTPSFISPSTSSTDDASDYEVEEYPTSLPYGQGMRGSYSNPVRRTKRVSFADPYAATKRMSQYHEDNIAVFRQNRYSLNMDDDLFGYNLTSDRQRSNSGSSGEAYYRHDVGEYLKIIEEVYEAV